MDMVTITRGQYDARLAEAKAEALADMRRRVEAWIRHGEAVPADVTTYDRSIVHMELRGLFEVAR